MNQRGRKKGADGTKSRELFLTIAKEEFANNGYHETKVSTIVEKAGLTQPSFYLYFQSKQAIFQEILDSFRIKLTDLTTQSRLSPGIDEHALEDRIAGGLSAIFKFFAENIHLTIIGFYMSAEADDIKEKMANQIKDNLLYEQEIGYFHLHLDMKFVSESLVGMIEYLTKTQLFTGLKEPQALAKDIVQILLYGMTRGKNEI
ncbi:putative HTH-type transcriptional regulator YdgC [Oceanobacillus neutriphilus]|uniref:HTH-type transcriptional regulator YdgC n=1 Tax=Oceanobacillus neutriphilus TaxID=531815 RepID=A0ABQ2NZ98_9BACI|nr:TetR/AcrR family transcriptional regulator [Oceanobacillus neutriphilus]GGP14003.1 putative HTH-type transcriptional regulator YdgC [Oceanobacillus neutriphilus]